jgi:hypothetical protein
VFAALQGGVYAASSAAEGAQTRLGDVAVAARTPSRELEAQAESTRAEQEVASKAAAYSVAGAAMLIGGEIAEVEAEAARRVAVST